MIDSILDGLAKPPPPLSELDELMSRDPLDLSSQDIDTIISLQRKARQNFEAGVKPKKETGPKQDLSELLKMSAPKTADIPRRKI